MKRALKYVAPSLMINIVCKQGSCLSHSSPLWQKVSQITGDESTCVTWKAHTQLKLLIITLNSSHFHLNPSSSVYKQDITFFSCWWHTIKLEKYNSRKASAHRCFPPTWKCFLKPWIWAGNTSTLSFSLTNSGSMNHWLTWMPVHFLWLLHLFNQMNTFNEKQKQWELLSLH